MLRLILILVITTAAGCTVKYVPMAPKMAFLITAVWFYLFMDFMCEQLYKKSLFKCFFNE